MKELIAKKKNKIYRSEASSIQVPKNPELSISSVWPMAVKVPFWDKYTPRDWEGGKEVDRAFFWAVLNHLNHDLAVSLIQDSSKQRTDFKKKTKAVIKDGIGFDLAGLRELTGVDHISSKFKI